MGVKRQSNTFIGRNKAEPLFELPTAGFERAAQENEQAARDKFHVAVPQATEMSRAEMRTKRVLKQSHFLVRVPALPPIPA